MAPGGIVASHACSRACFAVHRAAALMVSNAWMKSLAWVEIVGVNDAWLPAPIDCWALGALVFELLHAKQAFSAETIERLVSRIRNASPEPARRSQTQSRTA